MLCAVVGAFIDGIHQSFTLRQSTSSLGSIASSSTHSHPDVFFARTVHKTPDYASTLIEFLTLRARHYT